MDKNFLVIRDIVVVIVVIIHDDYYYVHNDVPKSGPQWVRLLWVSPRGRYFALVARTDRGKVWRSCDVEKKNNNNPLTHVGISISIVLYSTI